MKTQFKLVTMYNEVKNLSKECKSISAISRKSDYDRKTVRKYLSMSESELESYMDKVKHRKKKLMEYEAYAKERIKDDLECSAAQVEDWLREKYPDFPKVSSRTVFNFVCMIRLVYNLPKPRVFPRQCEAVEELPYGEQSQVDFGEDWLIDTNGRRVKVYFMIMVLSRSRAKFIYFTNQPVTTWFLIHAHEKSFSYFEGIPNQIVYDQDSTILVDENCGELIHTQEFGKYILHCGYKVYMCHKSYPQTKGKVEIGVRYVKNNFLRGRQFISLDALNQQALDWLNRTANAKVHSTTRLVPHDEWQIEKGYLKPFIPMNQKDNPGIPYGVRKDNTVLFSGNRYALPIGTYQGPESTVRLKLHDETLFIMNMDGTPLETFNLETRKGILVRNNDRKRDTSLKIIQLEENLYSKFSDKSQATLLITSIRDRFPRYIRDQFFKILTVIRSQDQELID